MDWSLLPDFLEADKDVVVEQLDGFTSDIQQTLIDELGGAIRSGALKGPWPGWFLGLVKNARIGNFTPNHALRARTDRSKRQLEEREAMERRERRRRAETPESREKALATLKELRSTLFRTAE
jgi:hypothetical protein